MEGSSTERIVNGYVRDRYCYPLGSRQVTPSLPQPIAASLRCSYELILARESRWQSDRYPSARAPRQYENITYNDKGEPLIQPSDHQTEDVPCYQQAWLNHNRFHREDNSQQPLLTPHDNHMSHRETTQQQNRHSDTGLHQNRHNEKRSPPFSFYEEKTVSRDSGTDSPSFYHSDEYPTPSYTGAGGFRAYHSKSHPSFRMYSQL